ncbi:MAG TPA: Ig-like domain-containing protein [Longimicrobiales bacterium]
MRSTRIPRQPARHPHGGALTRFAAALLALPLLLVGCGAEREATPLEPGAPGAPAATPAGALVCTADARAGTLSCATPEPALGAGARGALTLGGQNVYVRLASTNVCYEEACSGGTDGSGIFQADVTVQNLIGQTLATTDGVTGHPDGVRVFFAEGPVVTNTMDGQPGTAEVANATGVATFTGTNQPYLQYGGNGPSGPRSDLGADGLLLPDETSAPRLWQWQLSPNVLEFTFAVYVWGEVQYPDGWIDVTPAVDTLIPGDPVDGTATLTATVRDMLGRTLTGGAVTWTSSDPAVATVAATDATTAEVTAVAPGTATITATDGTRSGTTTVVVGPALRDDDYPGTLIGNVGINSADAPFSVSDNDAFVAGDTIVFAGWGGAPDSTEHGGTLEMTSSGTGMGQFSYEPPTGFTGTDRFIYVVGEDTATVTLTVGGVIWFIDNGTGACTADCDGRLSHPFPSLVAFAAVNDGAPGHPGANQTVFLYNRGVAAYGGQVTLLDGQKLVGQDATSDLATIAGLTPPPGSAPLPAMELGGSTTTITGGAAGAIVLGADNTLRGLAVGAIGGTAISGTDFGTLTLGGDVQVSTSGGTAIDLSNGAFNGAFRRVSANGGTDGIVLSHTTGTFEVTGIAGASGSGGVIQNIAGPGIRLTDTGPVSLSWVTIRDNSGSAVLGSDVAGFTLRHGTVSGNGTGAGDRTLLFVELTGTARIDTTALTGTIADILSLGNTGGTLDLQIHGSTFTGGDTQRDAIRILLAGTADVDLTATGNTFTGDLSKHVEYRAEQSAGGTVTLRDNVLDGARTDGILIIAGSGEMGEGPWSGSVSYDVDDNIVTNTAGFPINVHLVTATTAASMVGRIRDNRIGTDADPCSLLKAGLQVAVGPTEPGYTVELAGTHTAAVTGNTIRDCADGGILARAGDGDGVLNLTVQGNDVMDPGASEGFRLLMGDVESVTADHDIVCLAFGHPTDTALRNTLNDFSIVQSSTAIDATTLRLPGFDPSTDDVLAYLTSRNDAQGGGAASGFLALDGLPEGVTSCPTPDSP